ncbi:MAG: sugar ABC transporter ATP-binding protein [Firmicutes bacterium GWF2_51_9]|nr:MAG: sugar ABC transporter ATP-binding protein [Firmicutes bacterium GWF2_51_9]OGS58755.1 MAG: sugar ABC transporter ATP-binding protein [Firmicutes bacterium GWE2_51_13]HAM62252.1 sugar ABC transporter ATP-binding protein [Erysipelotrichaceae bacterium]HBZ41664.1 sugar ABC transporter ATP-binding protein [Erysipelotrichaceae bacterium]
MGQEIILEMNHISKSFPGVKALDDVSFHVRKGTVHALMGENGAGKSTLMKCLFGIYLPDDGEIILEGKKMDFHNPKDALNAGISMIHQELQPIPYRSIAENLWIGRYPMIKIANIPVMVDAKKMRDMSTDLLSRVRLNANPDTKLKDLSVSQIQSIEIAKAISYNAKIIIMDEPTSSLTQAEVTQLFEIINELRNQGVSIIYISHKMEEILRISDEVTIMRDGRYIGTYLSSELTMDLIITKMVGRELTNLYPPKNNVPGDVVFEVKNFTSPNPRSFKDVSFDLRRGEILGIGGLVGAQRTELVEGIFGIRASSFGEIKLHGKTLKINHPRDAIRKGISLLTEDRRGSGIFGVLSVRDNVSVASLDDYVDFHIKLNNRKLNALAEDNIRKLSIKTPSTKTKIQSLSGGNQQKVIISRWLARDPEIFILDEPTRGIDVGAKYEIYSIMVSLAKAGKSVIMISSEMPELLGMSDRILVMCEGKLSGIVEGKDANQEKIMELATKYM